MKDYNQHYQQLNELMLQLGNEIPKTMSAFGELHKKTIEAGALSSKVKELIALGIAITVRCDGCITYHVHDAIKAGATKEEIAETIGVAVLMGGGPSVIYGCEAMEAMIQILNTKKAEL